MKTMKSKYIWVYVLGIALLGGCASGPGPKADGELFITPPYLQNVRPDGITIMWESSQKAAAFLDYGEAEPFGGHARSKAAGSGHGTHIHKCVLNGLSPGTVYKYRVTLKGHAGSPERGSFMTAPGGPAAFAFAVWSDSQGTNHDAYPEDPYEPTKSMLGHMADSGIDFAVTAGDLAEDGDSYHETRVKYLDRVALLLGQRVPWYVAWGNHDAGRGDIIREFADLPSKQRDGFEPGWGSYSFDYGGCHFICIDDSTRGSDIAEWLEQDLQSSASRNARYTFLFVHRPPYCELWIDGDPFLRKALVPLMEQHGVDACFSGHTHEYERGYKDGVFYCVTGGGSWLDFGEPLKKDWPHMTVGGHHAIDGFEHGLVNEYVRIEVGEAGWTAAMHAFKPSGEYIGILDRFSSAGN